MTEPCDCACKDQPHLTEDDVARIVSTALLEVTETKLRRLYHEESPRNDVGAHLGGTP